MEPAPPVFLSPGVLTAHTRGFIALLVAAVTYLNYPTVDPRGRVTLVPESQIEPSYDFIIVGAGSAGCVVANRLTENPGWRVLLLEAGGDETAQTDVPLVTRDLIGTPFDWNYTTVQQASACRATNGICAWPRGRGLGGSSTIADNIYSRGNRKDYDGWAAKGNPGWSYDELLPYFRLSEDNETPKERADTVYHGSGGYLTVGTSTYLTPLASAFVQAGIEMGYEQVDSNAATQTGFSIAQVTLRNGTRCSTAKAFLRPARNRPNLIVSYYSTVTRILIGEVNKTAFGVEFVRNGLLYTVMASKEVILSGGVIGSPQLLLLSGVGPAEQLKEFNIPVLANLPVGRNLQDHIGLPILFLVNQSVTEVRSFYESGESILNYAMERSSPLSDPLGIETVAFVNTQFNSDPSYPDIEFLISTSLPNHMNELQIFFIAPQVLRPDSVGTVTLASTNPFNPPLIDPSYFNASSDFSILVAGAQMAYNLSLTPALQAYNSTLYLPFYPDCNSVEFDTTSFWECLVSNYSLTINHGAGSCGMGPPNDPKAVVDSRLRVHNISRLRVIDGSIMPTIVSGNPNAATVMIGERASAFIYEDYNQTNPTPAT